MVAIYRYRLLLLFLFVGRALLLSAQLPQQQLFRVAEQDGLQTGEVVSLAKDRKGYLWVCTQAAAQRFDGRQTFRFPFTETVLKVLADAQDRVWVQTRAAVYLFIDSLQAFQSISLPTSSPPTALFQVGEREPMVLAGKRCFRYQNGAYRFVVMDNCGVGATRFLGAAGKQIFLGDADSIFVHDAALRRLRAVFVGNYYNAFALAEDELLVSTRQFQTFLLHLPSGKRTPLTDANTKPGAPSVYALADVSPSTRLLATSQGLFQLEKISNRLTRPLFFHEGQPLDSRSLVELMQKDSEGNILFFHTDGLFVLPARRQFIQYLRHYRWGTEALNNNVRSFSEDGQGRIWMATTSGIAHLDPATGELKTFRPPAESGLQFPSYRQVLCIGPQVWIGTSGDGLWCYNQVTGKLQRPVLAGATAAEDSIFRHLYTWKLLHLQSGDLLVVGGTAVYEVSLQTLQAKKLFANPPGVTSRAALQDRSGRIWQGTTAGLTCFNNGFTPLFQLKDSFPDKRIAAFCEWQKDRLLIGSRGLFEVVLQNGRPVRLAQKQGLPPHAFVYCMRQDAQGFVWMGTDDGLYRYDPSKDAAVFFDGTDGVQTQAFNSDAAFFSRNGWMWMGGKNGVNFFSPATYTAQSESLQPRILSFQSANAQQKAGEPYRLPYHNRTLDFLISAPDLRRPFRLQYRYRLAENGAWVSNGSNNRVRIGQLSPGDYRLQVSASHDGHTWFDGREAIAFTVLKPWWQTIVFRLAALMAVAVAVWQLVAYRQRRRQRKDLQQTVDYFTYANAAGSTVQAIVWDIARSCIARLGFEDCVIYLLDEKRQVLQQKAALGAKSITTLEIVDPIEIPMGKGITGAAAAERKTIVVHDTTKDPRYITDDARRLSEIAVPIVHEGELLGVIDSEHRRKGFFKPQHRRTLETIAALCAPRLATAIAAERIQRTEAQLQALNVQMREATFTNLRLQMNPHFLFNTLTTIQYLVVSNQGAKASRYLDVFSGFLRSLLNHAEDTVVTLEEELRILKMYVELESLCLDESFVWQVQVDEAIEPEDVLVPFMLLQPFVENAIHHGLVHKVGEKRFNITLTEREDDCFECVIEDNGVGREASAAINEKKLRRHLHESKGLSIVQQRLHLLEQKTGRAAALSMEDLTTDGFAAGTRVRLLIPYYQTEEV